MYFDVHQFARELHQRLEFGTCSDSTLIVLAVESTFSVRNCFYSILLI